MQGKIFQHTTPTGPYLVVPGAVEDAADLEIRCEVDGQVMQQARTSDLLFSRPTSSPTPVGRSPCGQAA
jgi:2-keto-4-pentenoate hydratase/2-oxohepta-3-ene-1,7-dioic acid hydratase in catechol pathway